MLQSIFGNIHTDARGQVCFINDFDMAPIKRVYQIKHTNLDLVRAWQGHQKESKWFYCPKGSYTINCVQPDSWDNPSGSEIVYSFTLSQEQPQILCVPYGFATGIKANLPDSILLIYSDLSLKESINDDFRFPLSTWKFSI